MKLEYNGKQIEIEDAELMFRNFAGAAGQYNAEGMRNFCVCIDPETAEVLANDVWNVKQLRPRDPEEIPQNYIKVAVNFEGKYPPKVFMITSKHKTPLNADDIRCLDAAEFEKVDLIISASHWEMNGKSGIKAYLKCLYAKIVEDRFSLMYEDIPEESSIDATGFTSGEELPF